MADFEQADAEKRPVYLESSSIKNNAYYTKFGFVAKKDISLGHGLSAVSLSIMVREPQPVVKFAYTKPMVRSQTQIGVKMI